MRKILASAFIGATAVAAMGGAGIAVAGTHAPAAKTESFQMMTTSGTASSFSVIATGAFTAPGVDHENESGNTATFVFSNGTVRVRHSAGRGQQSFNPKTCLFTINEHGTYRLTGGTGRYAGITGAGTYKLNILAIGARSGGKCSQTKPPLAFHQVINASGSVKLK
jgi:hypothetical protein